MPNRPPLHRQYRARESKQWSKGFAHQQRITGRALQQRNNRIKLRDKFTCQNQQCLLVSSHLEVDHRIAVAFGGTDDDSNCRCLCPICHSIKSKLESKGRQLTNPDCFPLTYESAKRYSKGNSSLVGNDNNDGEIDVIALFLATKIDRGASVMD